MAGVRDPAFWRRFSVAVHLDEEKGTTTSESSSVDSRPPLKHTDTWLERNRKKRRRTRICGWTIALVVVLMITGAVFAIMFFLKVGLFAEKGSSNAEKSASAIQAVNPIGT